MTGRSNWEATKSRPLPLVSLLLAVVTHFGGELTDLGWANDGFAWEEMEIGNSDQRISLGV
jgi:hypothetical protein